jgi:hypothetical protein
MGIQLNEDRCAIVTKSIDVASVAANTSAEQDFTVQGLQVGDVVFVNKPTLSAGLVVGNARVKSANTLSITFGNLTGSPINPSAEIYTIFVYRPEKTKTAAVM